MTAGLVHATAPWFTEITECKILVYLVKANKSSSPNVVVLEEGNTPLSSVNTVTHNVVKCSTCCTYCYIIFIINGTKVSLKRKYNFVETVVIP